MFTELIVAKLVRPGQPHVLVLGRTHWTLGRTDLNVLCVGLVYQGVSIPLAYQSLQKPGNSNTTERTHLLTQGLSYFDRGGCCLVADREFIGRAWLTFLPEQAIDFVIRLHGNTRLTRRGLDQLTQLIHQAWEQPKYARKYEQILLSCT